MEGAGSKLTTSGTLTATAGDALYIFPLTAIVGSIAAVIGGLVQLGGIVFSAPALASIFPVRSPGLSVDIASTIEIGSAGSAAVAAITIDAGKSVSGSTSASLNGALVDNGTVIVTGGTLTEYGDISGSGGMQIGRSATLAPDGTIAATDRIAFLDSGATLSIGSGFSFNGTTSVVIPYSVGATLTGFQTGDSLILATSVSAATYTAGTFGSPGTLVLSNGAATVETLRFTGDFTSESFIVSPTTSNGAAISLIDQPDIPSSDPLFDRAYYLARNPDVADAGVDPYWHFLAHGWKEGRDSSPLFRTSYYLAHNPDVAAAGVDPLLHFATYGWHEGRDPSLLFSNTKYLAANPDVMAAGVDPLANYQGYGQFEGRTTFLPGGTAAADPLVNAAYYDKQLGATLVPTGVAGQQQAAASYDATGWHKGLNPDTFFDTNYYLAHNPDVDTAHLDPLLHYVEYGQNEGRTAFNA